MGGEREVVLGCFMAARLASFAADAPAGDATLVEARRQRAAAARTWFAGLALPAALRTLFGKIVDASAAGDLPELGARLSALTETASRFLDEPARVEMHALVERLGATVTRR